MDGRADDIIAAWRDVVAQEMIPLVRAIGETLEGNIFSKNQTLEQYEPFYAKQRNLAVIAQHADTALEIGFNAGFSSLLMLMANPALRLTCVDIGSHAYVLPCFEFIRARFPGRIDLLVGNSVHVLKDLRDTKRFDLVHIDGCHDPIVAQQDIDNSVALASDAGVIVMDDTDDRGLCSLWMANVERHGLVPYHARPLFPTACHSAYVKTVRPSLAFYTVFFGTIDNEANVVRDPPSATHRCFFFTNNDSTARRAAEQGWVTVMLDNVPVLADAVGSAHQAKYWKAMPHEIPALREFDFTVYMDSKVALNSAEIESIIRGWPEGKAMMLKLHKEVTNAWGEYYAAMLQPRYAVQSAKMISYIKDQENQGLARFAPHHFATNCIVRNMRHPSTALIGSTWYDHIQRCGIECQISFYFVAQVFAAHVIPDATDRIRVTY